MTIHVHRTSERDPSQRGRQLGAAFAAPIRTAVAQYLGLFDLVGIPDDDVRRVSESSAGQVQAHAPSTGFEIEGIAAGAGIEPWQAMMLNARTEILALAPPVEECSAVVSWPTDGVPSTLQTWDWRPGVAQESLVWALNEEWVTFCEFGQVAKIGVNARGLGLHFNILKHRADGARSGVPVHVAARMVLEQATTVADAIDVVRSLPFAASSVFTLASLTGELRAACAELSPMGVGVIEGAPGGLLTHTNHFLDPRLAAEETPPLPANTSRRRLAYLQQRTDLRELTDPVRWAQSLASSPVCVRPLPGVADHLNVETKATLALHLQTPALGVHSGGPRDVSEESWLSVPVSPR